MKIRKKVIVVSLFLFLDLTKAFDCMCNETFLQKMQHYGFRGAPLDLFRSYLSTRYQYVSHNNKHSQMSKITSGIAQGSLTGALFFIIYTNDLHRGIGAEIVQYADDTTILLQGREPQITIASDEAKQDAATWFTKNDLVLNINKTSELSITSNRRDQQESENVRFLGIQLDTRLTWRPHVEGLLPVLASAVYAIRRIRDTVDTNAAKSVYYALFHSKMTYGLRTWGASAHSCRVLVLQKRAVRALERVCDLESCRPLFTKYQILTLHACYVLQQIMYTRRNLNNQRQRDEIHDHHTRQRSQLDEPFGRLNTTDFMRSGVRLYNILPSQWKSLTARQLKNRLTGFLIQYPPYTIAEFVDSIRQSDRSTV